MAKSDRKILDDQIARWTDEIRVLAEKIAAAKGASSAALLLVTPTGDDENIAPELITEDVLRVANFGWPEGFEINVLNRAQQAR